jgi:FkbM family methyltransferase
VTVDDFAVALVRSAPVGYFRLARAFRAARPSLRKYSAETRYGRITCDIGEPGCFPLIKFGCYPHWAPDEDAIGRLALNERSVVVDIGANIGAMTKIFARRAKVVHAFEPSPRALEYLELNADDNVIIHPVALSDHAGVGLFEERESLDRSSLSDHGIEVPVRTLDSFDLKPDLIKIDVEGFEPEVLRGAQATLKHGPILLFEALSETALADCKAVISSANSAYRFERVSEHNHFAICSAERAGEDEWR